MLRLGAKPFRHSLNSARRFAAAKAALDTLGPAPTTGTPWGVLYENAAADLKWLGMLGNGPDKDNPQGYSSGVGDCVECDDLRCIALWTSLGAGPPARPNTRDALALYAKIAGFDPRDQNSDQGTEPHDNAKYMQAVGWTDAYGRTHKLDAWAPLDPKNHNHIKWALQVFGCAKLCIDFPSFASTQFDANQAWDYSGQAYRLEGGHDVQIVQYEMRGSRLVYDIVTWGRRMSVTDRFFDKFATDVIAPCSRDFLKTSGSAPNNLNLDQMLADLAAVK